MQSVPIKVSRADLAKDATWFVHSVDDLEEQATIVRATREVYRQSPFLDHRMALPPGTASGVVPFAGLGPAFQGKRTEPTRYIFHISHVGSTLISRLVEVEPSVLALREPELLRWLSRIRLEAGRPESFIDKAGYARRLSTALALLARPLELSDKVVVKASSYANVLADDILRMQPNAQALAVYLGIEPFTATILKGAGGWRDIRGHASSRVRRLNALVGENRWRLVGMSPGELTAMSWLVEMATLDRARQSHPERIAWLDFEAFLADPDETMVDLCHTLALPWSDADGERMRQSGELDRYSKINTVAFTASDRAAQMDQVRQTQAAEIQRAQAWLDAAFAEYPRLASLQPLA